MFLASFFAKIEKSAIRNLGLETIYGFVAILTWFGLLLLNQNRNAACGRRKEEILSQLRTLAKSEPNLMNENVDLNSFMSFQCLESEQNMQSGGFCTNFEHDAEPLAFPAYEVMLLLCF